MATIAVVEDQATIAHSVAYRLGKAGHAVSVFGDGREALDALTTAPPDLAIIDWMLPGVDGLELSRRLRVQHPDLMIIMLTARGEEIDRVLGLESGADDYMVKPFSLRELEARVKNLLRRAAPRGQPRAPQMVARGAFELDLAGGRFRMAGREIALAPREMDLMRVFMEHPGVLLSREDLLDRVWGSDFVGEPKTVDVHIRRLREKLEADPANPRHVVTVRSRGYRFDPE